MFHNAQTAPPPPASMRGPMKGTRKVAVAFAGAVLVVALAAAAALSSLRELDAASKAREFTANLIIRANDLLAEVSTAEAGQRAYAMTAEVKFLTPYNALIASIQDKQKALRQFAAGRPSAAAAEALDTLMTEKLAQMREVVERRERNDVSAVIALTVATAAQSTMSSLRGAVERFNAAEELVYAEKRAIYDKSVRNTFIIILIVCGLALLFPLSFSYQVYQSAQRGVRDRVHVETQRLLQVQEDVNRQLQQAYLTLHVSEEKLAVTLNSIDDAVIATDAAGGVTFLNPLAERLTGWTRADAIGQPVDTVFRILNSETRQAVALPVGETLAQGTTLSLAEHTLVVSRGGSECEIADSCAPIRDRDGNVVGAVLVFRDVTEKKRLDNALRDQNSLLLTARATADKANLAKSDFLSSMSHELRTPLNAILGFAQLIDSGKPAPTPLQKRSVDQILKAGWYLLELINEILDLSLIESGKVTMSREPVSLAEVMLECRAMIEPQAAKRNIVMAFPSFAVPCFISADRTRVKQVLINLLFNAIKYNKPGGTVTVTCVANPGSVVRISVRDTGAGLSPEQLKQLFQPFNRMGQESGHEEGTGIGLVVTKRLVEMMGGSIGVDSAVGRGSSFWIELVHTSAPQFAKADPLAAPAAARPPALAGTPRQIVLYVEDNPANLELVEQLIARRDDLRLLSAADAEAGIEFARVYQPQIILMDINLPGMSGLEAMRLLNADPETAHIPIIALSANAVPRDIAKGLEAGFFNYLTKPIKVDEFMESLDIALKFTVDRPAGAASKGKT
jgi:PAS domain S-box-containing protein